MSSKLRTITAAAWRGTKQGLAYALAGIDWFFTAIATGCMAVADLAEDAAVRMRR